MLDRAFDHSATFTVGEIAIAEQVAAGVPAIVLADEDYVRRSLGSLAGAMPAQATSNDGGKVKLKTYQAMLAGCDERALAYACRRCLDELDWMPTVHQLKERMADWVSPEAAAIARAKAIVRSGRRAPASDDAEVVTLADSRVELVINESTMEALPFAGEIGAATELAWDWQITIAGRKQRIARGAFIVTGDGVTGADDAPAGRTPGYGHRQAAGGMRSGATLSFGDESMRVTIDGAGLAFVASGRAEKAMTVAELAAASAAAAGRYFPTRAAGEAGSVVNQMFSTDAAGTLVSYRRTSGGSVEIARSLTPALLASAAGAAMTGYSAGGDSPALRSLNDKAREQRSLPDKAGDAAAQLASWIKDMAVGGTVATGIGTVAMAAGVTVDRSAFSLVGEGPGASALALQAGGTALFFDKAGAGGLYQSAVKDIGFYSTNMADKVAVRSRNNGSCAFSNIGISTGNWLGANSIGLLLEGREHVLVDRCVIATARPVVIGRNPTYPTLSADHFLIRDGIFVGTSAVHECIEIESGACTSNLTIDHVALVGGRDGIRWINNGSTNTGASIHLRISDVRAEQGLDPAGYALRLLTGDANTDKLQELLVSNFRTDPGRRGMFLRGVLRATLENVTFDNAGGVALDDVLEPGGARVFINCTATGSFNIVNGRCVSRSAGSRARGFTEIWVYDSDKSADVALLADAPCASRKVSVAAGATVRLIDDQYSGRLAVGMRNGRSASFDVLGANHVAYRIIPSDPADAFAEALGAAGKVVIAWSAGQNGYVIQNNTAGPADFWVAYQGSAW